MAAWRILVGVWAPKHWDLSIHALAQYTTPKIPPENPWIDRSRSRPGTPSQSASTPSASPNDTAKPTKRRAPPSRRLIRHVLRARIDAVKSLKALFEYLELSEGVKRVRASSHQARAYGGTVDPTPATEDGVDWSFLNEPRGWRSTKEVITFLRARGAKIAQLKHHVPGDWAALSSEGEGTESDSGLADDLVWVPSSSSLRESS